MICIPIPKSQVSVEFESFEKKAGKSWKNAAKKMMIWFLMVMSNVSDMILGTLNDITINIRYRYINDITMRNIQSSDSTYGENLE